jgi:hypothetical protein
VPPGTDTTKIDALIARVGAECDAFGRFKLSPLRGADIPGRTSSLQTAVSRWEDPIEDWMKPHVREKMGPLRLKLLNEMISMSGVGWPDFEKLFDVSYQTPSHKYTLELKAATTVTEKQLAKVAPTVTIKYTNAFGWNWQREYALAGVQLNVGARASVAEGKKGAKVKPGGGLSVTPISLDITGTGSADPIPIRYAGSDDFTGGFSIVKGTSAWKFGPAGGSLGGLTAVVFHGMPTGDVSFPFIAPPSASVSGGKDFKVDVGLGEGAGVAVGRGDAVVTPPPIIDEVLKLNPSFREWAAVIGPFETGSPFVTPAAAGIVDQLNATVYGFKKQTLDPQADQLRSQSVDPDKNFSLTFEVVGMTSRSWGAARSNAERLRKNQVLSANRATAVETAIHNRFPDVRSVSKQGQGAHAVGPSTDEGRPMLDDAEAQALYEQRKAEAQQIVDPVERKRMLQGIEANFGPASDQQAARRVYVFCRWEGLMIMKVLVPRAPVPTP